MSDSAPQPATTGTTGRGPHASMRGPLGVGLAVSAALHVLAVVFYAFLGTVDPSELAFRVPLAEGPELAGTQLLLIDEVEDDEEDFVSPDVDEVDPIEAPVPEVGPDRGVVPGVPGAETEFPRIRTAGEVLTPDVADSVLLRGVDPALAGMTEQEELEARIRWAIEEYGDAEEAARRAAEDALDWTHTDEDGGRWGVSPGKLHLGSLTLPLPIGFGRTRGVDAAADEQDDRLSELDAQAARGRVWENWQRRAQVIRERVDRERAERATAADTTRSR